MRFASIRKDYGTLFTVAAWAGALFGIVEGAVLTIARAFPAIGAPYKTSVRVMWIAPALNVVLFIIAAAILTGVIRVLAGAAGRHSRVFRAYDDRKPVIAAGLFVFLGTAGVLSAARVIHPLSVVLLAAGVGVAAMRFVRAKPEVVGRLRARLWTLPVMIGSLFLMTSIAARRGGPAPGRFASSSINVILIVLDTVRRDHFFPVAETSHTPNIDTFAARGIRYDDAWSVSSWSLPTQASILTGLSPEAHGADWPSLALSGDATTLAEYLGKRGYATAAFSSNSSWATPEYLGRGFQRFDVYTVEDHLRRTAYGRALDRLSALVGLHYAGRGRPASDLNQRLLRFIDEAEGKPFFAFMCYMDVNRAFHNAQLNHPFWKGTPSVKAQIAAYRRGLEGLDAEVGRLLRQLEERGVLGRTLVVITSDHGESFGRGHEFDRNPPGHGTSLYPEQTRVPLFLVVPGASPRRVATTVSIKDVAASIALLTGDRSPRFSGRALPGTQADPAPGDSVRPAFATLRYGDREWYAMARGGWEYVRERAHEGIRELLIEAPVERNGPAKPRPAVEEMRAAVAGHFQLQGSNSRSSAR